MGEVVERQPDPPAVEMPVQVDPGAELERRSEVLAVAFLILKSAWALVRQRAHVLLEGAPDWLDREEMQARIAERVPAVANIHHVHVWGLTPQDLMLTMHLRLGSRIENHTSIVRDVKAVLREHYGIDHSTIEVEIDDCADH